MQQIFLFSTTFRATLVQTRTDIEQVPGYVPGVMRPGSEVSHSPPSSAEVKNGRRYISTTLHGVDRKKI
jgi:hypothetical protein